MGLILVLVLRFYHPEEGARMDAATDRADQWHVLPSDHPRAARATFHFRGHWALRCALADAYCA